MGRAVLEQGGPSVQHIPEEIEADSVPDVRYRGLPGALSLTRPRAARLAGWPHG